MSTPGYGFNSVDHQWSERSLANNSIELKADDSVFSADREIPVVDASSTRSQKSPISASPNPVPPVRENSVGNGGSSLRGPYSQGQFYANSPSMYPPNLPYSATASYGSYPYSSPYTSMYGGMGHPSWNNSYYSPMGVPSTVPPHGLMSNVLASGQTTLQTVSRVVETFGRFSQLLEMNNRSLYTGIYSFVTVVQNFGELMNQVRGILRYLAYFGYGSYALKYLWESSEIISLGGNSLENAFESALNRKLGKGSGNSAGPRHSRLRAMGKLLLGLIVLIALLKWLDRQQKNSSSHNNSNSNSSSSLSSNGSSHPAVPFKVTALFAYQAQQSDELSFPAGSSIEIMDCQKGSWWMGRMGDQSGLVPSNFVVPQRR